MAVSIIVLLTSVSPSSELQTLKVLLRNSQTTFSFSFSLINQWFQGMTAYLARRRDQLHSLQDQRKMKKWSTSFKNY